MRTFRRRTNISTAVSLNGIMLSSPCCNNNTHTQLVVTTEGGGSNNNNVVVLDDKFSGSNELFIDIMISPQHHNTTKQKIVLSKNDINDSQCYCYNDSPTKFLQSLDNNNNCCDQQQRSFNSNDAQQGDNDVDDYMIMMKSCSSLSACTFDDDFFQSSTASLFSNFDQLDFDNDDNENDNDNCNDNCNDTRKVVEEDEEEKSLNYRRLRRRRVQFGKVTVREYNGSTTTTNTILDTSVDDGTYPTAVIDDDNSDCCDESENNNDNESSSSSINTSYSFTSVDEHDQFIQRQRRISHLQKGIRSPIKRQRRYVVAQQEPEQEIELEELERLSVINSCA